MAGRAAEYYDDLCEITPVVRLIGDTDIGLVETVRKNAALIASMVGEEEQVDALLEQYDSRIASLELVVDLDPDYIFVIDRDAAIGTSGAQLTQEIMENELIMDTRAYKDGHLVILEHSGIWYTAEGGITALGIMLDDLEAALQ